MAPEHVFSTAAKLCADVLGGAADGGLDLAAAAEVVGDALRLLASKHMKARRMLASKRSAGRRAPRTVAQSLQTDTCVHFILITATAKMKLLREVHAGCFVHRESSAPSEVSTPRKGAGLSVIAGVDGQGG